MKFLEATTRMYAVEGQRLMQDRTVGDLFTFPEIVAILFICVRN